MNPSSLAGILVLAVILAGANLAAANPMAQPSHIELRTTADTLSHLGAHRPGLPPPALLVPLGNGLDGVLKGHSAADEARLVDAITRQRLNQMVLRVASANSAGQRMGLVKLQAGRRTGEFVIDDLRDDAAACLNGIFGSGLHFDHLDVWSVVPGAGTIGGLQEHYPVFSLSVSRSDYQAAVEQAGTGPELVDHLTGVRYNPVFTRYAPSARSQPELAGTAFACPPLVEEWDSLLAEASQAVASAASASTTPTVEAIFSGPAEGNLVALTIDDGPSPLITPLILDILAREGVQATFFVVGQVVEHFPALTRMIVEGGHELGNHSYSHPRITQLGDEEIWAEIVASDRIVRRATGQGMHWFRPPGGRATPAGLTVMASLGYKAAFWSQNTGDWTQPSPEQIVQNATEGLEAGGIILMHQVEMCSVEALPGIIARVREMGLEPTTLSRLAENGGLLHDDPKLMSEMVNGQIAAE